MEVGGRGWTRLEKQECPSPSARSVYSLCVDKIMKTLISLSALVLLTACGPFVESPPVGGDVEPPSSPAPGTLCAKQVPEGWLYTNGPVPGGVCVEVIQAPTCDECPEGTTCCPPPCLNCVGPVPCLVSSTCDPPW